MQEDKIDVVIPWVNGADPNWIKEKRRYSKVSDNIDDSVNRYRDWDNLQYIFRGIETFMPWVNDVYFVTWGHVPDWLNMKNAALKVINHEDYIPHKYLPTFSSHTIELNLHRINGLSERFIYFNDDTFILKFLYKDLFFKNGVPCDYALLSPIESDHRYSTADIFVTNIEVINDHFIVKDSIKKNLGKWFTPKYGKRLIQNFVYLYYNRLIGLRGSHLPNPYLKSTFERLWEVEYELLDSVSSHKFRTYRDVNQHLFRFWQIMSGEFYPLSPVKKGIYRVVSNNNDEIRRIIETNGANMLCINENATIEIENFEGQKEMIKNSFEKILPKKSSFEV